jgi:hypothetical protein
MDGLTLHYTVPYRHQPKHLCFVGQVDSHYSAISQLGEAGKHFLIEISMVEAAARKKDTANKTETTRVH